MTVEPHAGQGQRPRDEWIVRGLLIVVLVGSALASLCALRSLFDRRANLEAFLVGAGIVGAVVAVRRWGLPGLPALVVVFLLTRVAVVFLWPAEPVSDFAAYYRLAQLMATGEPLPPPERAKLFNAWGYPLLLTPWLQLFGPSLVMMKLFFRLLRAV